MKLTKEQVERLKKGYEFSNAVREWLIENGIVNGQEFDIDDIIEALILSSVLRGDLRIEGN